MNRLPFHSLYRHGFARVAVCVPRVRISNPNFNAERTIELARRAAADRAVLALFPELGLAAYTNDDLFHQDSLLEATLGALGQVVEESAEIGAVLVVGAPLVFEAKLFNCAVVIHRGHVLGVVPKTYLPNYREFYEKRQFAPAAAALADAVDLLGQRAPFGNDLIFTPEDLPGFCLHVEICEDLWVPIPPSSWAALAGATVLANLSASNITIGKAEYRRELVRTQSAKCAAAYLYAAAGAGESTTDLAWDGHALVAENGELLAESERFQRTEQRLSADLDLDRLRQERLRWTSFHDSVTTHREALRQLRPIPFELGVPGGEVPLRRAVERRPFVPADPAARDARCHEAYQIQVAGLTRRLEATGLRKLVIGVSGGLDSSHALVVCCRVCDALSLPRTSVLAYTLPGFATGSKTRDNAWRLMRALGVTAGEIDIRPSCLQMLKDLGHPFAAGEPVYDITFENVQAGERTSHLFRLANFHGGLVVGTGDLSELALGWNTYGVGDQMSHYNVNTSVPKTLVQHLVRWLAEGGSLGAEVSAVLTEILATEITPELIPAAGGAGIGQRTEDVVGPYDLQDFNLYYLTRFGLRPSKVAFLAHHAWGEHYDLATIKKWLKVFLYRFFQISQFKRSASPNGPKVGSGGSLSPRGDWRAPADGDAEAWLEELETHVPS